MRPETLSLAFTRRPHHRFYIYGAMAAFADNFSFSLWQTGDPKFQPNREEAS